MLWPWLFLLACLFACVCGRSVGRRSSVVAVVAAARCVRSGGRSVVSPAACLIILPVHVLVAPNAAASEPPAIAQQQ